MLYLAKIALFNTISIFGKKSSCFDKYRLTRHAMMGAEKKEMPTKMAFAKFKYVEKGSANSQLVAILEKPYKMSLAYADIPEPDDDQVRVKIK